MKTPRLFRPMMVIGAGVIALVIFISLMMPNARNSLPGMVLLIVAGAIGVVAVVLDLRNLAAEIKQMEKTDRDQ